MLFRNIQKSGDWQLRLRLALAVCLLISAFGCRHYGDKLPNSVENVTTANVPTSASSKDFTSFSILGQVGTIGTNSVDVTVPFGTDVTSLIATFVTTGNTVNITGIQQDSGVTANDFSTAVIYTVVAVDGTTKNFTVNVTVAANSAKEITAFSVSGQTGTIGTSTISITVPFGTNVTALAAVFSHTGASVNISGVNQVSGSTTNDFTTQKIYTVVAANGSTKDYTVIISVAANSAKDITAFSILGQAGTIGTNTIDVTVPYGTDVTSLIATFSISGASLNISGANQVSGVTVNNFTTPRAYTVVAVDSSTKNYTITVSVAACAITLMGGASNCPITLSANVSTFAGPGPGCYFPYNPGCPEGDLDATGTSARFRQIKGVTTDGTNLYVVDTGNNNIRKIVISTGAVTKLAGGTSTEFGDADGTGSTARFRQPSGITTDGTNLYVIDNQAKIRKIVISTGAVTTLVGPAAGCSATPPCPRGDTDGTGTAARFNVPEGITTDGTNLYVADSTNSKIRKIVISTRVVTTIAGPAQGSAATGDTDATGNAARFNKPTGITYDGTNLFIADGNNNKIRKLVISTGVVTTIAGPSQGTITSGDTDAVGNAARFYSPVGITTDRTNLFVADGTGNRNNKIRKILISTGAVTTIAGPAQGCSPGCSDGDADGTGTAVRFSTPWGITTDGISLFISDNVTKKFRRLQ
ncbi:NHL repeat containing protein [Turneriella parva]|uniref:NHL repeat containing protein n=1 Tax=Turneriella parva (strain ATCC BAA-1111 / DSM 21527 / NCTC 11395 / H) TaxID=869212 RepID=I4B9K6_TURPD|nr:NHL repeat containing protein [Turneriella parva]AFM13963.1 NHL repeat containing protein [Turneriella parva DSM 21527]